MSRNEYEPVMFREMIRGGLVGFAFEPNPDTLLLFNHHSLDLSTTMLLLLVIQTYTLLL